MISTERKHISILTYLIYIIKLIIHVHFNVLQDILKQNYQQNNNTKLLVEHVNRKYRNLNFAIYIGVLLYAQASFAYHVKLIHQRPTTECTANLTSSNIPKKLTIRQISTL